MFLKKNSAHGGRTTLTITKAYRENGKVKHKTIKSLGFLDELENIYEDPISHFKDLAKQMTDAEKKTRIPKNITISCFDKLSSQTTERYNLGYSILQKIYYDLELDNFLQKSQRAMAIQYKLDAVLRLLILSRIQYPGSKKKAYDNKGIYFEKFDFSEKDMYRSLDIFDDLKLAIQKHIHNTITAKYGRDTTNAYYDCTNYYFEIDESDGFRMKGPSKEHRRTPIVQMGLLMDNNGIPMAYDLFPGNESEKKSLTPILKRVRREYGLDKVIVVADKGLNTSDNIFYNLGKGDGYIYSQSIRGANKELKDFVLNEDGYLHSTEGFKVKSRVYPKTLTYHDSNGKIKKQVCDQKQVIFYSPDYDKRAKAERQITLDKAEALIKNPGNYTNATSYGAAGYIKNIKFDKKTGEVISTALLLDINKIKEEEAFDGYYAIVTSEINKKDNDIIETYRGLWRIEESFKITKSDFKARPVYVSTKKHIEAHFLTCFIALVMMRLMELKLERRYSIGHIIETLNKYSCTYLKENIYVFDYRDEILEDIEKVYDVDFSNKYLTKSQIKKILKK